jgi:dipeptidyl aminopeptidase/acylaminoacyl peptidase
MRIRSTLIPVIVLSLLAPISPRAIQAQSPAKRPMTFEDMMHMRRLGDTDVSPDGNWLLYSVTDVDLAANTRTPKLWIQPIAGGDPKLVEGTQPGDGGARFSHDGKQLLFLSSRSGSQQIWLADFDPATGQTTNARSATSSQPNPKTNVRSREGNVGSPSLQLPEADNAIWSPDGQSIVFTAAVYPDCPAIVPDSFAGEKCNSDRDAAQADSKVKARLFTHLLYKHWNHFTGDKRSHLFRLSVETGAVRDLTPNDPHDVPPFSLEGGCGCAISPDSKELAFTENLDEEPAISTNSDIFALDLTNPTAKPVKISTSPGGDLNPAYSPDGKYLAWRSQARAGYESDKFRLIVYDRVAKSPRDVLKEAMLSNGAPANFDTWVNEFAWSLNSQEIFLTSEAFGETEILQLVLWNTLGKLRGGAEYSDLKVVPFRPDLYGQVPASELFASMTKVDRPSEVVITTAHALCSSQHNSHYDVPCGDGPPAITHLNDTLLAHLDLPRMEDFWFQAKDGVKVQGFLIKPPSFDPAKKYPVKFLIHGGPQGAWGDAWSYRWNAELFAANGYVVVMINPRGSTGYGQAFVDGVNGDWSGKPFTDLLLGLDYAEQHYPFIDKNRECALGASYGGFMANWILGHTDRFKCIVTHDGMFNPESAYGSTEELWFNEWEFKGKPWDYYGKPDSENPFRKWSPAMSAKNFKTPTLVIHSQLDYRLDVSEGYQLFTTLQRLKVPSKMLYFPDEGHWIQKPQNSELWYKTVNDWVDQWTKPQ